MSEYEAFKAYLKKNNIQNEEISYEFLTSISTPLIKDQQGNYKMIAHYVFLKSTNKLLNVRIEER